MRPEPDAPQRTGTIRCPHCGVASDAPMPSNACLYYFECPACRRLLRPTPGDCCVFCSYGEHVCPPKAAERP